MHVQDVKLDDVKQAIEELLYAYVQCIDDDRLEEWPEFFTDRCVYKIISRENYQRNLPAAVMFCDSKGMLKDRITAHRHANIYEPHFYRHLVSNIRITGQENDAYLVQANYLVIQTKLDGDSQVYNTGKYVDKIVFEGGKAKFKEKYVVFDTLRIPTLLVTPI
ncbi:aromatic-ring-hydroxylating dioxygenase subunit beta [Bacillaceae bacterium]